MFFSASSILSLLKCDYCEHEFTDVIKLIPDCGNKICEDCHDCLRDSLDDENKFRCQVCNELHTMPNTGLTNVNALMKMLQLEPSEKPLSKEAKRLKVSLDEVQDKIDRLKAVDHKDTVNAYCDQLQLEVMEMVESSIKHINKVGDKFIREINKYRQSLTSELNWNSKNKASQNNLPNDKLREKLTELSAITDDYRQIWEPYFTDMSILASDDDIEWALSKVNNLNVQFCVLEEDINKNIFKNRFLRFQPNNNFSNTKDLLGTLIYQNVQASTETDSNVQLVQTLTGHSHTIQRLLFSENDLLISGSRDSSIKLWNSKSMQIISELKGSKGIYSMALLHNGWLASGSGDGAIKLWDLKDKKLISTLVGHTGKVFSLGVLKNGNLVSCSNDDTIKIWNPYSSENNLELTIKGHGVSIFSIVDFGVLLNGHLVSCSNEQDRDNTIRIWNDKTGSLVNSICTNAKNARSLLILSNDKIAVGFQIGLIKLIDPANLDSQIIINNAGEVMALLQLPNGHLCSAGSNQTPLVIKIWSTGNGNLVQEIKTDHTAGIYSLGISDDGKLLASGSKDKTIKIWFLSYD